MNLRWYQEAAVQALFEFFATHNVGNPIVAHPTGTGKSHVIAEFCKRAIHGYPQTRIMKLTHVKELIEQNSRKLKLIWPDAPLGIHSAGLHKRDVNHAIIYGGVASVVSDVEQFGYRDLLIIDECHLLSDDDSSMYQFIIAKLKIKNPNLKVIGFSATAFRMGVGMLTDLPPEEGGIFTHIVHDMTSLDNFDRLIAEGFLSPPIPKRTKLALDVSKVRKSGGDFARGALEKAVDKEGITRAALQEMVEAGRDRQKWLIFASGIEHANHIADMLTNEFKILCVAVHSKMKAAERDRRIEAFKNGSVRAIANNNVLTTGFDHPPVDLIGMLRPTMSPVLWVQMIGRGTRPSLETGKQNCLVLDYARNTARLGPINDPRIPKRKGEGNGEIPIKLCEPCGAYNHMRAKFCCSCGNEFEFQIKIEEEADTAELLRDEAPKVETLQVQQVIYTKHVSKTSGRSTLKVDYYSGLRRFTEYVNLEHAGYPLHVAHDWWKQRHRSEPPATVDNALQLSTQLKQPKTIRVWLNKRGEGGSIWPEVLSYGY